MVNFPTMVLHRFTLPASVVTGLVFLAVGPVTSLVMGQEVEKSATPISAAVETVPAPNIVCDEPVFDFQVVDNSQTVKHTFVLRNDGDVTLEITDVKPDCGCTVAKISSHSIAPGEEAALDVELKLKGRYGFQNKRIRIFNNDPDTPSYAVTLTGKASSLVDVSPRNITARGTLTEPIGVQTVKVTSAISHPLTIVSVDTGNAHVEADFEAINEGFSYEVTLSPKESMPGGQMQGNLRIYTSSEAYPDITVPYMLILADSDFVLAPKALLLKENPNEPIIRQVVLRPGLVKKFTVTEVIPPNDEIQVDIRAVRDGTMIRLRELRVTRDLDDTVIRILTDVEGADPVELPIRVLP